MPRWRGARTCPCRDSARALADPRRSTRVLSESRWRETPSVTALSFLPDGRQHLLLTASEASTSVRLWDIRAVQPSRGRARPVSVTQHPESHARHRHFAVNSLVLSGDGARLYALSRDNTVYAYATGHLILGSAPELERNAPTRMGSTREGLGPIYGFRHGQFHAGSFYVKAALRKSRGDQPELLAVGSTTGCPVLFPTDERFLQRSPSYRDEPEPQRLTRSAAEKSARARKTVLPGYPSLMTDTVPIYEHGTALVRGHTQEVSSVCWTANGALVSVGDDQAMRVWREGPRARQARMEKTMGMAFAEVERGYDD